MKEKKRVLFLTNKPSFYRVKFFNELGKYVDLDVFFEIKEQKKDKLRDKNWFDNHFKNFNGIFLSKLLKFSENYYINFDLFKKIKVKDYDDIIIGQYSTLNSMILIWYLNKIKKKFILSTDGGFIKEENALFKKIRTYFISSADSYISNSKVADEFLEYYGAKRDKIFRYHFTSYTKKELEDNHVVYHQKEQLKKDDHIQYDKVVLCISNFEPRKNIEPLIYAWSKIPHNEKNVLKIIGTGQLKEKIQNLINELELKNVETIDFVKQEELKRIYKLSDVLVLNSKLDVWGLVISEAMTFGIPVISTDKCLAGTELIEDGKNGYLIQDDVNELQNKLEKMLQMDKKEASKMTEGCYRVIQNYTIEQMVQDYLKIMK